MSSGPSSSPLSSSLAQAEPCGLHGLRVHGTHVRRTLAGGRAFDAWQSTSPGKGTNGLLFGAARILQVHIAPASGTGVVHGRVTPYEEFDTYCVMKAVALKHLLCSAIITAAMAVSGWLHALP